MRSVKWVPCHHQASSISMTCFCCLQTAAALWISMLMSAVAGMLAVSVVAAAFWWIR